MNQREHDLAVELKSLTKKYPASAWASEYRELALAALALCDEVLGTTGRGFSYNSATSEK